MKVLVVTPNEADRVLAGGFLADWGIDTVGCAHAGELASFTLEETGCVVLVEESLAEPGLDDFHGALLAQPAWSDLPVVVVAGETSSLAALVERAFPSSGNVTLLQRPLHPVSLVSAVTVALRARERQLQVRDLLAERAQAVARRDQFMAMLAHELRNPLAPIRNAAYLMGTLDVSDPIFVRTRAMIEKQAKHMSRLVDDLLDVSRLERGKLDLKLQDLELNAAIEAAVESCRAVIDSMRHRLVVRPFAQALWIRGDPVRIEQVFDNLLLNAAKFTPPGGTITIEALGERGFAHVRVRDTGKGIRANDHDSVFELFSQAGGDEARTTGGLGIGLTLVRQLTELHGGSVTLDSDGEGHGSTFEVRLPLASPPTPAGDGSAMPGGPAVSHRILVVEDGPDIRESLAMLMARWRQDVTFATTGPEGVEAARRLRPGIILIDIGLPGFDGYEVARRIRHGGDDWSSRVRLVALTGYGQAADRERAQDAGFDVHLVKPVDPERLLEVLRT